MVKKAKLLLSITIGQLIQLKDRDYLSEKGLKFFNDVENFDNVEEYE